MARKTTAACLAALIATFAIASTARADDAPPSAERLRSAAAEYDAGRRAYVEKDFEGAASHFENAFHDAPSAAALRNAIRARRSAKQYARAATLASLASARYPDDPQTAALQKETLADAATQLHKVTLACTPECGVAADGRAISISDAKLITFFLEPGNHAVVVSWSDDRTKTIAIEAAHAGGHDDLSVEAPKLPPAPVAPAIAVTTPHPIAAGPDHERLSPRESEKPLGPALFFVGLGLTAAGVGATVVSGLDAQNNPGADAVRRDCVGQGTSCPEYQKGRSAQLRTNVILAAAGGVALATAVIGVFFTQWSHPSSTDRASASKVRVVPFVATNALGVSGSF